MSYLKTAIALMFAFAFCEPLQAAPYVPADGAKVIERLPRHSDPEQRELQSLRRQLAAEPGDIALSAQLARRYIDIGRKHSDPRYLGYAQVVLAPWWTEPAPPPDIRILRATILQSQHRFAEALVDLDGLIKQDPRNPQAWLTRATVLQVQGRFDDARASCARLYALTPELVTTACLASVASVSGQAGKSHVLLSQALERDRDAEPSLRTWAHTLLAEIAARQGHATVAERHFEQALALDPSDSYLLAAYADFLLDQRRGGDVLTLLNNRLRADGLLLRYAEALRQKGSPQAERYIRMLQDRFAAAMQRGDSTHLREQARFTLHLLNDAQASLRIARRNWNEQKEPADIRLLLESALAAGDRDAVRTATGWIKRTGLEDNILSALAARAGG